MVEGLRKVRPEIQVHFSSEAEKEKREYKDTFTEDLPTEADIKKKYGAIIWCKYTGCTYNQEIKGLQRTQGTILKNKTYKPIAEQEAIWTSLCTRGEIAIKFDTVKVGTHAKVKVPSCFSAATKKTGHIDFSNFLNSDGSALGGNIDSQQVSDAGYDILDSNSIYDR
tara:strand:+ start:763 stop:1263 length:501 start_codon:yes stop_codon:yes gene_type:complete